MIFSSIRSQLLAMFCVLIVVIIAQGYVNLSNQDFLSNQLDIARKIGDDISAVRELEATVVDLQRTTLTYKQTKSNAMVTRFNSMMIDANERLALLSESPIANFDAVQSEDILERMRDHIAMYTSSFEQIVENYAKREDLLNTSLYAKLSELENSIQQDAGSAYWLQKARNAIVSFQIDPDTKHARSFNDALDSFIGEIPTAAQFSERTTQLKKDMNLYTQLVRGDLFLTNVVMAGSANEFLYLSGQLVELVNLHRDEVNHDVRVSTIEAKKSSQFISVVAIALLLILGLITNYRILTPINVITRVFKRLSKGDNVVAIPGQNRNDEIGLLSEAANVFRDKNKQTQNLLMEAQRFNDVQQKLNQELRQSQLKAEQATVLKSRFLANMSHEIRTPINGIVGLVELLQRQSLPPISKDYVDKIEHSGRLLLTVVNDVLDFSKIEAGKLDIDNVPFSMHSLFESILAAATMGISNKNLQVRLHAHPSLPAEFVGDPMRITQVLLNLCTNAIKFTHQGEITLNFNGKMNANGSRFLMQVIVSDTGIGMKPNHLEKVFQPFTQGDDSTNRRFGGSGLGLAIVKQLTELMGGGIVVHSLPNVGSTFTVSFDLGVRQNSACVIEPVPSPAQTIYFTDKELIDSDYLQTNGIAKVKPFRYLFHNDTEKSVYAIIDIADYQRFKANENQLNRLRSQFLNLGLVFPTVSAQIHEKLMSMWQGPMLTHPFTPAQYNSFIRELFDKSAHQDSLSSHANDDMKFEGHILLVEDNEINQIVAGEMLRGAGITYEVAENGEQALQKLSNSDNYDVVLMDVQMPVMDGLEATRLLRERGFDKPIVGLSANAMKHDMELAAQTGMTDYLTKPISRAALLNRLNKYLKQKH